MNELALFAGGGGGLLASKWLLGWRTVCYVENAAYPVEVIKARIRDGLLDDAPIWDDVQTFDGRPWAGSVDIITAGFPCQPFSVAGNVLAENDPRNAWPATARIIGEVNPEWVFLENVPNLLSGSHGYYGQILKDLAENGYDARWDCIPAAAVGAPHLRNRLWIVAHANSQRLASGPNKNHATRKESLIYNHSRIGGVWSEINGCLHLPDRLCDALRIFGNDDGVAARVDRLAAIGNGQVPAVVRAAWHLLTR